MDDSLVARLYKTDKLNHKSIVSAPFSGTITLNRLADVLAYIGSTQVTTTYSEIRNIDYKIDGGDIVPVTSLGATQSLQVTSYKYLICNCGSPMSTTPTYTVSWKNSQTLSLTNQLSSQKTTTYSIKMGTKIDYAAWSGTTDLNFGQTFATTTTSTEQNQTTLETSDSWSQPFKFDVKENFAKIIKIDFSFKKVKFPFIANLYLNGTVTLENVEKTELVKNGIILKTTIKDLSSETIQLKNLLPDSLRWFQLEGFLEYSHANQSDVTVQIADQSLPETSDNCVIQQAKLQEQIKELNARENQTTNVVFKQK